MEKKQRIISAAVFIIIIFIMPVIFIVSEKKVFSETENRPLAKKPDLSISAIFDKSYMNDLGRYISDNFQGRMAFIRTKMFVDRFMGKNCINNIYLGDNMLIERLKEPDYKEVSRSVQAVNEFAAHYVNTKTYFMLVPDMEGKTDSAKNN